MGATYFFAGPKNGDQNEKRSDKQECGNFEPYCLHKRMIFCGGKHDGNHMVRGSDGYLLNFADKFRIFATEGGQICLVFKEKK